MCVYAGRMNFLFNSHLEGLVGGGRKSAAMEDARCSSSRCAWYHTPALHRTLAKHPSRSVPPATRPIQVRLPLLTKLEIETQFCDLNRNHAGWQNSREEATHSERKEITRFFCVTAGG